MSFNSQGYDLKFIQTDRKWLPEHLSFVSIYKFTSPITKCTYIVRAEYHRVGMFIVKFYLQKHSKSDYKYHLILNKGDAFRVLMTLASLLPTLLANLPTASFAFAGARTWDSKSRIFEPYANTQRFRIYRQVVLKTVGEEVFDHLVSDNLSGYLLLNKRLPDKAKRLAEIREMLGKIYVDFE